MPSNDSRLLAQPGRSFVASQALQQQRDHELGMGCAYSNSLDEAHATSLQLDECLIKGHGDWRYPARGHLPIFALPSSILFSQLDRPGHSRAQ